MSHCHCHPSPSLVCHHHRDVAASRRNSTVAAATTCSPPRSLSHFSRQTCRRRHHHRSPSFYARLYLPLSIPTAETTAARPSRRRYLGPQYYNRSLSHRSRPDLRPSSLDPSLQHQIPRIYTTPAHRLVESLQHRRYRDGFQAHRGRRPSPKSATPQRPPLLTASRPSLVVISFLVTEQQLQPLPSAATHPRSSAVDAVSRHYSHPSDLVTTTPDPAPLSFIRRRRSFLDSRRLLAMGSISVTSDSRSAVFHLFNRPSVNSSTTAAAAYGFLFSVPNSPFCLSLVLTLFLSPRIHLSPSR